MGLEAGEEKQEEGDDDDAMTMRRMTMRMRRRRRRRILTVILMNMGIKLMSSALAYLAHGDGSFDCQNLVTEQLHHPFQGTAALARPSHLLGNLHRQPVSLSDRR
jgi:hypothetical protein